MIIIIYYSKKVINLGYYEQLKSVFPIFSLSICMGVVVYLSFLIVSNVYLQLFFGIILGVGFYLFISKLFNFKEYNFLIFKLKELIRLGINVIRNSN